MPKYIPYDYNQSAMVVFNYLDQPQPGTFEHAIHYISASEADVISVSNDKVGAFNCGSGFKLSVELVNKQG